MRDGLKGAKISSLKGYHQAAKRTGTVMFRGTKAII